jgi:hypothetical protein
MVVDFNVTQEQVTVALVVDAGYHKFHRIVDF